MAPVPQTLYKKLIRTIVPLLALWLVGFLFVSATQAQLYGLTDFSAVTNLGQASLLQIVATIINVFLGLLGVLAVVLIIYGGFVWMTSGGNEENIARAKKILTNGVIGLAIILTSFTIANFIFRALDGSTDGVINITEPCAGSDCLFGPPPGSFRVSNVDPKDSSSNVKLCASVQAVFNGVVDEATVNGSSVKIYDTKNTLDLTDDAVFDDATKPNIYGTNANGLSVIHKDFSPNTKYRAHINTSVASSAGVHLTQDKIWNFATGTESDSDLPKVVQVYPVGASSDVCRNTVIQVIFNEVMLSTTLNTDNIELRQGGANGPIIPLRDIRIGSDFKSVSLYPQNTLTALTSFTVTLKSGATGIRDSCGNQLDGNNNNVADGRPTDNYSWTFTTGETIDCRPLIEEVSPNQGPYGDPITITGKNFALTGEVNFSGTDADSSSFTGDSNIDSWAGTRIEVKIPVGATSGPLTVKVGSESSNSVPFTVTSPYITDLSPNKGGPGQFVTISGVNFGTERGTVNFGVGEADFPDCSLVWTDNQIIIKVPNGAPVDQLSNLQIKTASGLLSNVRIFEVTNDQPGPGLCDISPVQGYPSTSVQAVGERFGSSQGASQVFVDKMIATTADWTDSSIELSVPIVSAGRKPIFVRVGDKESNRVAFGVLGDRTRGDEGLNVISRAPEGRAVCRNEIVDVVFNEALNRSTVTLGNFTVALKGATVNGALGTNPDDGDASITFTPEGGLWARGGTYTIQLKSGIKSTMGKFLSRAYTWSFTTADCLVGVDNITVNPDTKFLRTRSADGITERTFKGVTYGSNRKLLSDSKNLSWVSTDAGLFSPTVTIPASSTPVDTFEKRGDGKLQARVSDKTGESSINVGASCSAHSAVNFSGNSSFLANFDNSLNVITSDGSGGKVAVEPLNDTGWARRSSSITYEDSIINRGAAFLGYTRYAEPLKMDRVQQLTTGGKTYYYYPYSAFDYGHYGNRTAVAGDIYPGVWCGGNLTSFYQMNGTLRSSLTIKCVEAQDNITGLITSAAGSFVDWVDGQANDGIYFSTTDGSDPRSNGLSYFVTYQATNYNPALVQYPSSNSAGQLAFNPKQGTLSAWVRPRWDSGEGPGTWGYIFTYGSWWATERPDLSRDQFQLYFSPDGKNISASVLKKIPNERALLPAGAIRTRDELLVAIGGGDASAQQEIYKYYRSYIGWPIDFKAGAWRHVSLTWDSEANKYNLFIDGNSIGLKNNSVWLDNLEDHNRFTIGLGANAVIDEFSFYNEVLRPLDIWMAGCNPTPASPVRIDSITPDNGVAQGAATTVVTIRGSNFGTGGKVIFGNIEAPLSDCGSWSDTQITVAAPAGLTGTNQVRVQTSHGDSVNSKPFTANNIIRPGICSITPRSGVKGTTVTVKGRNFTDNRGPGKGNSLIAFSCLTAEESACRANLNDEVPSVIDGANPVLSSSSRYPLDLMRSSRCVGGTNDGQLCSKNIDCPDASGSPGNCQSTGFITRWTDKQIALTLPEHVRTGEASAGVRVSVDYGAAYGGIRRSNPVNFFAEPFITSITPSTGSPGTWITIRGGNFGANPGTVTLAAASGRVTSASLPDHCVNSWGDNEIIVKVPSGGITGFAHVITAQGIESVDASSQKFTYDSSLPVPPGLCSIAPDSIIKTELPRALTLRGDNFTNSRGAEDGIIISVQSDDGVIMTGQSGEISNWSDDQITTTAPSRTTSGDVVVHRVVTLTTGADCIGIKTALGCLGGSAPVQKKVTLQSNPKFLTIALPVIPYQVTSVEPANPVCRNAALTINFDKSIGPAHISSNNFSLTKICPRGSGGGTGFLPQWLERVASRLIKPVLSAASGCVPAEVKISAVRYKEKAVTVITEKILDAEATYSLVLQNSRVDSAGGKCPLDYVGVDANSDGQIGSGECVTDIQSQGHQCNGSECSWNVSTTRDVCQIDALEVSPATHTFNAVGEKLFQAQAYFQSAVSASDPDSLTGKCASGFSWTDVNKNNRLDKSECHKPIYSPLSGANYGWKFSPSDQNIYQADFLNTNPTGDNCSAGYAWVDYNNNSVKEANECQQSVLQHTITSSALNGRASLTVTADGLVLGAGKRTVGVPLETYLCEAPWRTDDGSGDPVYNIFNDDFNFSLKYCRDTQGRPLPNLEVSGPNLGQTDEVMQEYFFTDQNTKDAIALRIYKNDKQLSPRDWYNSRTDITKGSPQDILVGGYQAIKDGNTIYVAVLNLQANSTAISNVYVISVNQGAAANTQSIYKQMVDSITFNVGLTETDKFQRDAKRAVDIDTIRSRLETYRLSHQEDLLQGGDFELLGANNLPVGWSTTVPSAVSVASGAGSGKALKISVDRVQSITASHFIPVDPTRRYLYQDYSKVEIVAPFVSAEYVCYDADKNKSSTIDDPRLGSLWGQVMYRLTESLPEYTEHAFVIDLPNKCPGARYIQIDYEWWDPNGLRSGDFYVDDAKVGPINYPKLESGTYLSGQTNSAWPSWQAALGNELGKALPIDPLNKLTGCSSGAGSTTCWNNQDRVFTCKADSSVYWYSSNGTTYTLASNFELPGLTWPGATGPITSRQDRAGEVNNSCAAYNYIYSP